MRKTKEVVVADALKQVLHEVLGAQQEVKRTT
jgi:hypothetical protein